MMPPYRPKLLGERAECAFMNAALDRGFTVAQPFGDSAPYDLVLDASTLLGGRGPLWRVQVKSAWRIHQRCYRVNFHRSSRQTITPDDADFLVAYVVPEKAWYIIPVPLIRPTEFLTLYPHRKPHNRGRYERFREAWHLLRSSRLLTLRRND